MLVKVASVKDFKDGEGKVVEANGKILALFRQNGQFFAIDNACLHRGGPLGEGMLEETTVTCPLHGWQYDISSGSSLTVPGQKVQSYKVSVQGSDVMVEI